MRQLIDSADSFTATLDDGSVIVGGLFSDIDQSRLVLFEVGYGAHVACVNLRTGVISVDGDERNTKRTDAMGMPRNSRQLIYRKTMCGTYSAATPNHHVALTLGWISTGPMDVSFGVRVFPGPTHEPEWFQRVPEPNEALPEHVWVERESL